MSDITQLRGIQLVPVVELSPMAFATRDRNYPAGSSAQFPIEWAQYWRDSLADSGLTGIVPVRPGSWHVPIGSLSPSQIDSVVRVIVQQWGGLCSLTEPDAEPVFDGGLALLADGFGVLVEPHCCGSLRDAVSWKESAGTQGSDWEMLWIGHPWLSVRYRPPWLILSEPHDGQDPIERWAVDPQDLDAAADAALAELRRFAAQLEPTLLDMDCGEGSPSVARQLAGIDAVR